MKSSYTMHKRDMRGKWDFIDMINGGLLALLTRFGFWIFSEGGSLLLRFHLYSTNKARSSNQYGCNAQSHDCMLNLEVHVLMCEAIPFKWGILHLKCKFKPTFEFNMVDMNLFEQFESF